MTRPPPRSTLFPYTTLFRSYTFKHALTHEVTYGGLLHERRRELHARVVGAIEALYGERLDEQVERLAHHAVRDRKSTRLNSSHTVISYAVFCLKKKKEKKST